MHPLKKVIGKQFWQFASVQFTSVQFAIAIALVH